MSQALYERYKDALRRGHMAALRGRLDLAVAAYEAAAAIAPDRALPYASLGDAYVRLGQVQAAEAAFAEALLRAPGDETALRGRAELREAHGERSEAAGDFETLAETLERADRLVEAMDAARRALELAESRARRATVQRLASKLESQDADPSAAEALRLAMLLLEPLHPGRPVASLDVPARGREPVDGVSPVDDDAQAISPHAGGPEVREEHDPGALLIEAEALLDGNDITGARRVLLDLAARQRALGHLDAALDACLVLMAIDPSDTEVQLEIASNQVARGWAALAGDKVRLLAQLADLDGNEAAAALVAAFGAEHGVPLA